MKKLNNFIEGANLFKIYLLGTFLSTSFIFFLFQIVGPLIIGQFQPNILNLKISIVSGLLFGLMFMLMILMTRKSIKFWNSAKLFQDLIDKADTKDSLESLYNKEFKELKSQAQGEPHHYEVKRLYTILETKHKYIK